MKKLALAALSLAAISAPASAASTVSVVTTACSSLATGCLFNGNINGSANGNSSYLLAQNAYNAFSSGPDIALTFLGETSPTLQGSPGAFGQVTGMPGSSGTWSTPGFAVKYLAIKASDQFVLYDVSGASSGSWNTFAIPFKNNAHNISHMAFFGSPSVAGVPEPSAWAMLIMGFGLVGEAMRARRRTTVSFA